MEKERSINLKVVALYLKAVNKMSGKGKLIGVSICFPQRVIQEAFESVLTDYISETSAAHQNEISEYETKIEGMQQELDRREKRIQDLQAPKP